MKRKYRILLLLLLLIPSCSAQYKGTCTFSIYEDKIEIYYWNTKENIIIPIEEGESWKKAYDRYKKQLR